MKFSVLSMIVITLLAAGCNKGASPEQASTAPAETRKIATTPALATEPPADKSSSDYTPQAGNELELDADHKLTILSVEDLDSKASEHAGLIALEGRVAESYPDRSSFILVDCDNMKGCKDGCCPQARIPVRLEKPAEGDAVAVPGVDEMVIVIAELSLTETGYTLAVRELRPARSA